MVSLNSDIEGKNWCTTICRTKIWHVIPKTKRLKLHGQSCFQIGKYIKWLFEYVRICPDLPPLPRVRHWTGPPLPPPFMRTYYMDEPLSRRQKCSVEPR